MNSHEHRVTIPDFSIEQICNSGQCFRMTPLESGAYQVIALGRLLELRQEGDAVIFSCTEEEYEQIWRAYFDLDTDYAAVIAAIDPGDAYLVRAAGYGSGIRILRQDLWEMIITFIISQQNNIKRIRGCIERICEKYGEQKYDPEGAVYYAFPTPQALSTATEEELCACNLGYRSRYLVRTAACVAAGSCDLEKIRRMDYPQAREELLKLCGVGEKVADCVCLFALHHLDAFPVDTHIRQVLEAQYPDGFPYAAYKGVLGILQQYIFYYDLRN